MSSHTITASVKGYEFEIDFDYAPASKGARDSLGGVRGAGPPLEPDEPEEIDIVEWRLACPEDQTEIDAEGITFTAEDMEQAVREYDDDPDPDYGQD